MREKELRSLGQNNRGISRRGFLREAALAGVGTLVAACSKRTPTPTATYTTEPTRTPTPEPLKPPEIIKVDIPVTIERYSGIKFDDITEEVPEPLRNDIKEWVAQPEFLLADNNWGDQGMFKESVVRLWPVVSQCGQSFVDWGQIRPNPSWEFFYYNGNEALFYTNIRGGEQNLLGWEKESMYINFFDPGWASISGNGKILYKTGLKVESPPNLPPGFKMVVILVDIPNGTKTVIKDTQLRSFESELTADGNKLLLALAGDPEAERGIGGTQKIYLLDLNTWQVRFKADEPYSYLGKHLNEDGTSLYLNKTGRVYNTITGEEKLVRWPAHLSSYGANASPNLNFITRRLGMFSAMEWVEGQWGIITYTPQGFFQISSPRWSFSPWKVDNEGNIYTVRNDIFKFEDGTYKLVRAGLRTRLKEKEDGKPIEVSVNKVG